MVEEYTKKLELCKKELSSLDNEKVCRNNDMILFGLSLHYLIIYELNLIFGLEPLSNIFHNAN